MASYEKMIYMDCLRLVESVDFDIKIVSIRDRMQKLQPLQDAATVDDRTRVSDFSAAGRTLRGQSSGFQISLLQTSENSPKPPQDGL